MKKKTKTKEKLNTDGKKKISRKDMKKHKKKLKELKSSLDWMDVEEIEGDHCIVKDGDIKYVVKGIKVHPLNIHMLDPQDNFNVIQSLAQAFNRIDFRFYWRFVYETPNLSKQNHHLMNIMKYEEDDAIKDIASMFLYHHQWFIENYKEISFYFIVMETEKKIDKVYSDLIRYMNDTRLRISKIDENDFKKIIAYDFDNPMIDEYYFSVLKGYDLFDMKDGQIGIGGKDEQVEDQINEIEGSA